VPHPLAVGLDSGVNIFIDTDFNLEFQHHFRI